MALARPRTFSSRTNGTSEPEPTFRPTASPRAAGSIRLSFLLHRLLEAGQGSLDGGESMLRLSREVDESLDRYVRPLLGGQRLHRRNPDICFTG